MNSSADLPLGSLEIVDRTEEQVTECSEEQGLASTVEETSNNDLNDSKNPSNKPTFLTLPAEIRMAIYTFLFLDHRPYGNDIIEDEPLQYLHLPQVACASRQLRKESIPIFFETVTFQLWIGCDARERHAILESRGDGQAPRNKHEIHDPTSDICGRLALSPRAAHILARFKDVVFIRNLTIKVILASAITSLQKWLPERIVWMRKHGRRSPEPPTMWQTTIKYGEGALEIHSTIAAFPAVQDRSFASLRLAARAADALWGRHAVTKIFDAPDDVVEDIMEDVESEAKELAGRVGFKGGFSMGYLEGIVRMYRVGPHVVDKRAM